MYVSTDNFGKDTVKQNPLQRLMWPNKWSCNGTSQSSDIQTEGNDISETFWKLKQQLELGCKTELILLPKTISERFQALVTSALETMVHYEFKYDTI